MKRILAVMACGVALSGCSSSWMPSFELPSMPSFGGASGPATTTLAVESDPPGADARASTGTTCRTPCRLDITTNGPFTVSVALNGYLPQTVPVQMLRPDDPRLGSQDGGSEPRLDPNPVYVELRARPRRRSGADQEKAATPCHRGPPSAPAPVPVATQAPAASAPTTAVRAERGPGARRGATAQCGGAMADAALRPASL